MSNVEKYLVLNNYFLQEVLGVASLKSVREVLLRAKPGVDPDGVTYFCRKLIDELDTLKIEPSLLMAYDKNIQTYVTHINKLRNNVTLKYFQYLALLVTEIYLDRLTNDTNRFVTDLNVFLHEYANEVKFKKEISNFTVDDLKKLAFWMATGSGKTLIMHMNYLQFMRYKPFEPSNIILVTPNEALSSQHYDELLKSGIPATLYHENLLASAGSTVIAPGQVLVIEITKLKEEKRGGGVTLPVDAFEGRNLVFVDEGHKGKGSEERVWARLRQALGATGFTFEYSATFGQILDEKDWSTMEEYAKSIIFNYSYKYFYNDQYGKDFRVMNVKKAPSLAQMDYSRVMFTANLLSFYQQLRSYQKHRDLAVLHNLEKPLWIFVGATVQGESSDVALVTRFFREAVDGSLKDVAGRILGGAYLDDGGNDLFGDRFDELRQDFIGAQRMERDGGSRNWLDALWNDLMQRVFHGRGSLRVVQLSNAPGEFGLRVGENPYFGVINVGQDSGLVKALKSNGFELEKDVITSSLFEQIKETDSRINVLLGSRKFIEGWDTWRVSSMGLLNMGRGQGPQIIQLFGRGVRIKGKNMTLQRSGHPDLSTLETLFIYGIKANYLEQFLEAIRKEGVDYEEILVPIQLRYQEKWKELVVPVRSTSKPFEECVVLVLGSAENIMDDYGEPVVVGGGGGEEEQEDQEHGGVAGDSGTTTVTLDLSPQIGAYDGHRPRDSSSTTEAIAGGQVKLGKGTTSPLSWDEYADYVDWEAVYLEMLRFKASRGYWNLVFDVDSLKRIWKDNRLTIYYPGFEVRSMKDVADLQRVVTQGLKKYVDAFYSKQERHWKTRNMKPATLEEATGTSRQLSLFTVNEEQPSYYVVKVPSDNKTAIQRLKSLVLNMTTMMTTNTQLDGIPNVPADGSGSNAINIGNTDDNSNPLLVLNELVIVPLLSQRALNNLVKKAQQDNDWEAHPTPLNEGEEKFLRDLHHYVSEKGVPGGFTPYVMRNQSRTGIGFQLEWAGFYPDFIIWLVKPGGEQIIVFVDPHGLIHAHGLDDEKINFCCSGVKTIEKQLRKRMRSGKAGRSAPPPGTSLAPAKVTLDAFIISTTPYDDLIKQRPDMDRPKAFYEQKHVLFLEDKNWPAKMLTKAVFGGDGDENVL